jgi:glycine C-acetyltransferase/8-amino-7-oxononanoate synthase
MLSETFLQEWQLTRDMFAAGDAAGLNFWQREVASPQGAHVRVRGRDMLMFASNNYLGLATDPYVRAAAIGAIEEFGTGACGCQLMNGYSTLHARLEAKLAAFKGTEAAVLFSTGYQTNLATIAALVGPDDLVVCDKLNHASIMDGCRFSGATLRLFAHNDMDKLARILRAAASFRKRLVVVDGVYSMDGDLADLPAICDLAEQYGAAVMVDEAHATGVLGAGGRGTVEHFQLEGRVDIIVGTMSKALASVGGFVAGPHALADHLRLHARSFVFSAALPPAAVAAAHAALERIESDGELRARLWQNANKFRDGVNRLGYDTGRSETPIVPILLGNRFDLYMVGALEAAGLFVCPVVPPGVRADQARLRAHVSAAHSEEDIQQALEILARVGREFALIP